MIDIAFAVGNFEMTSGIVRVVTNVVAELSKTDKYTVSIICTGASPEMNNALPSNISVYDLNIEKYGHRNKYLVYSNAIKKLFRTYIPDVLVVSGMEHILFYSAGTANLNHVKLIAWEHRNFYAGPKFRLEWWGKRVALKSWNGILCITKKDYKQYKEYKGNENQLYQIYNLTDFSAEKLEYNCESKKIISCGYLENIKGFDMLISVAEKVLKKEPLWSWDIYGEGMERETLERVIAEKKLDKFVHLKGYTKNLNELYGQYSFFVLTSREEGMGMVLIEAQKSGLPLVSFDIKCGPSDVITHGENGYLVHPFDLDEMADKIRELINDKNKRRRFSENSQMNLMEFDKKVIVEKWRDMLEHIQ